MVISQYGVYLVNLDPAIGHEIKKTKPCIVLSPDEMNRNIHTAMIALMTTKSHDYPSRVGLTFKGKAGWVALDQIRTVDKNRLVKKLGVVGNSAIQGIKSVIKEMLVD